MTSSFVVLHGAPGVEIPLLDYLSRVLFYPIACGGIAVLVFWWMGAVETVRSALAKRRNEANGT